MYRETVVQSSKKCWLLCTLKIFIAQLNYQSKEKKYIRKDWEDGSVGEMLVEEDWKPEITSLVPVSTCAGYST